MQPPETVALRATGHRQGPLRARTPSARRRAIAGVARLGLTALPPTRRPSNRPRTVLESSSNRPARINGEDDTIEAACSGVLGQRPQPPAVNAGQVGRDLWVAHPVALLGGNVGQGGAHPIERSQTTKPSLGASSPMAWGSLVLRAPGRRMKRGSISARIKPPAASSKLGFFQTEGLRRRAISPSALGFPQSAASHRRAIRR